MENGIPAVLPALVGQAVFAFPVIFDKAVAVAVAIFVDPGQRRLDIGPQRADGFLVAGAVEIARRQQHEQRRGIDAAVIAAERHFAQIGHFAGAHLMQDLARLGIGGGVEFGRLGGGQILQHALGQRRDRSTASPAR